MSESIQSQVLDSVVAALGGAGSAAYRCRMTSFTAAQLPADNVLPVSFEREAGDTTSTDRKFRFAVRHMAAATDGVDVVADARYVRGQQLILADPQFGGLAIWTKEVSGKWEFEGKGETEIVALVVTYEVDLTTSRTDPSQPGI